MKNALCLLIVCALVSATFACSSDSNSECTVDEVKCEDGMLQTCANNAWGVGVECGIDHECKEGNDRCTPIEVESCTNDDSKCKKNQLVTCVNEVWAEKVACDEGQVCNDGERVCTDVKTINVTDHGATGDGVTDDTAAIQAAVDAVAGTGGTVLVPDGTYMIDALTSIRLKSNMTFQMSAAAVLKAIPNGATNYAIVEIKSASNVTMIGGTITGDRYEHTGTAGEWGMGVWIGDSHDILIDGVTARDCWGDGFYQHGGSPQSTNITLFGVVSDNNCRQGLSIENVDGMLIQDSVFKNTAGKPPQAGIDIEPYAANQVAENILIKNSHFLNNATYGILLYKHSGPINNVVIDGNSIAGNGGAGIGISYTSGHQIIENTIVDEHVGLVLTKSSKNIFKKNSVDSPKPLSGDDGGNTISDNICNGKACY